MYTKTQDIWHLSSKEKSEMFSMKSDRGNEQFKNHHKVAALRLQFSLIYTFHMHSFAHFSKWGREELFLDSHWSVPGEK